MRSVAVTCVAILLASMAGGLTAQRATPATRRVFDTATIRRNMTGDVASNIIDRADGFTMLNVPVSALVARAYSPAVPLEMVGLPRWATSDRYDVTATTTVANPTAEIRNEMLRTLLADRFKLTAHVEQREQPAYDLVLSRTDRRTGPGIQPSTVDCSTTTAARAKPSTSGTDTKSAGSLAAAASRSARCSMAGDGDRIEGDTTIPALAELFGPAAGRPVVDKTGLKGTYHVVITYAGASRIRRAGTPAPATPPPTLFDAVQDQLGMKLQPSTMLRDTLVIDRLEKPAEN
jgi:uncharacterized protein (TIGR03435 family)